jgi:hypothetical protein
METNIVYIDQKIRNFVTHVWLSVDSLREDVEDVLQSSKHDLEQITQSFDKLDTSLAEYPQMIESIRQYLSKQEVA